MPRTDPLRLFTNNLDQSLGVPYALTERDPEILLWDETALRPALAAGLRSQVLKEVYFGDYHQDVTDLPRLSRLIEEDQERLVFWGSAGNIADLRAALGTGALDASTIDRLARSLGTATFINRERIFGAGIWELSRTGSASSALSLSRPMLAALARHWAGSQWPDDVVYCTPRNRPSAPRIPGGMGIQRFHQRGVRSAFLGFAPWHLMAGGSIELLEFRALLPPQSPMRLAMTLAEPPHVPYERQAEFCRAILESLGAEGMVSFSRAGDRREANAPTELPAGELPVEPLFLTMGDVEGLLRTVQTLTWARPGCPTAVIARLPLTRETLEHQQDLDRRGFSLLALELPRVSAPHWLGQWVLLPSGRPIVRPAYFRPDIKVPCEVAIANYVCTELGLDLQYE